MPWNMGLLGAAEPDDYELIQTVEFDGNEGLVFTNIPQYYRHLELRWRARSDSTAGGYADCIIRPNNVNDPYSRHDLTGNGSSVTSSFDNTKTTIRVGQIPRNAEPANRFGAGITSILDYSSINKFKTVRSFSGDPDNEVGIYSGLLESTNPITEITFLSGSLFLLAGSSASLYGIRG